MTYTRTNTSQTMRRLSFDIGMDDQRPNKTDALSALPAPVAELQSRSKLISASCDSFIPGNNVKHSRDLLDIENIGEFAFAMCAMGLVLAIIAFAAAFFLSHWI